MISPRCMEKVQGGVVGFPAVKYLMQLQTPTHPLIPSPVGFTYRGPVLCLCANTGRALNSVVHGFVADPRWLSPTPRDHGHTYLSPSGYPPSWVEFESSPTSAAWWWPSRAITPEGRGRRLPPKAMSSTSRQHPLLLWLDAAGWEGSFSLGAYYLLLFACAWFVLRRGRAWARARSFLIGGGGDGKSDGGDGCVVVGDKAPKLTYVDSERNRRLLARTPLLGRPYVPSPWLGHRVSARCSRRA